MIASLGGDFMVMGIVSAALGGLNLLTCVIMVIAGIVALIKRGPGRMLLAGVLVLALVVDVVVYAGGLANTYVFVGGDIVAMITGGLIGLIVLVVKCLAYLVFAALLVFLGKER